MQKNHKSKWGLVFVGLLAAVGTSKAQFTLTGQVRTRTEIRDGLGNLSATGSKAAAFTSQRTRLAFGYKWDRLTFGMSVQDVRVWGQDASTINNADGSRLMLHEAWGEVVLANIADTTLKFRLVDNLSLKIGRQELVYDDVRLLGNLDWLQQARRFDAALLKVGHHGWQLDLGGGFNQNSDAFGKAGTYYTAANTPAYAASNKGILMAVPADFVPTASKGGAPVTATPLSTNGQNQQFKAFQMAYLSRKFGQTKFSALFFKDDFAKYRIDSIGSTTNGYVYGRRYDAVAGTGLNSRITYGAMLVGVLGNASSGKINWQLAGYLQSGKDRDGKSISGAYHLSASAMLQKGKFAAGPGIDILSGNKPGATDVSKFDPLYGTPHKHWGYMDYFYVGTGSPNGGIKNIYLKTKYTGSNFFITFDVHNFALHQDTPNALDGNRSNIKKQLGTEYDLIANYNLNKFVNLEAGYCVMKGTQSLEYAKLSTMDKTKMTGQWAYLMVNIRPDFFYVKPVAIKQ